MGLPFLKGQLFIISKIYNEIFYENWIIFLSTAIWQSEQYQSWVDKDIYYNFFKTKNKKIKLFGCISRMMCGYSGKSFGRKKRQSFS